MIIIKTVIKNRIKTSFKKIIFLSILLSTFIYFLPQLLNFIPIKISELTIFNIINILFCCIILLISFIKYKYIQNLTFLFIGVSFSLFALSHLLELVVANNLFEINLSTFIAIIRIISYSLILIGMYSLIKEDTINKILKYITSTKLQVITIGAMIFALLLLFYFPNKKFLSSDVKPDIINLKPKIKQQQIKEIETGLYIKNFPVFDVIKNEFEMNAIVWFQFDPHKININTIKNFVFEKGKIVKKSKINSKIIGNKLWVYYKVKVEFNSNLNYKFFPIEDHKIYVTLSNPDMDPNSEILVSYNTNLTMKDKLFTGDWKKIDHEVEYGYLEDVMDQYDQQKINKYPAVLFELSFKKAGIRKTLVIFLPLFMVFFLSLFSLITNIKNYSGILTLSAGSTSALIFDLVAIENMSPNVRYFTIANKIYTLLLISAFIILLINIYIAKEMKFKDINMPLKEEYEQKILKKLMLIRSYAFLFFVFFILLTIYSMLY
ncbi:hypothetical protein GF385_04615 [Candidatus Dependentiae bacterium]|nr:hypothetical protein [Candidatus Dependentiae bacterium]